MAQPVRGALAFAVGFIVVWSWAAAGGVAHNDALADAPRTGTWQISVLTAQHLLDVELGYRSDRHSWTEGQTYPLRPDPYPGLTSAQMNSTNANVQFKIVRDAGAFDCEGYFKSGNGSGMFTYVPNAAYADALATRGIDRPSDDQQFRLMLGDVRLAEVDKLRSLGVSGLSSEALVRLAEHDAGGAYVDGLVAAGVKPASVDELVRLRDHDVLPDYVTGLARYGYHPNVDDLVRLRDHDVSLDFVARLKAHGYNPSIDDLIRLRDAGI